MRELADFSYLASHDLRTPLRAIDGFSNLLDRDAGMPSELAHDYLRRIREAAQRMGRIIDNMLALSRISRAQSSPRDLDFSALAAEVMDRLQAAEPQRQVQVRIEPGLCVRADPELARLLLVQLLDNAWKFMRGTESPVIEIGREEDVLGPELYVRDNGAGFDMAYAHRLFGAFQRLHGAESFAGSGIGLAMVRRIVHRHGGEVRAQGNPGQGAAFFFTLPSC